MLKKKILVFNWKMNPTTKKEALALFLDIKKEALKFNKLKKRIDFIVAPPFVYLDILNSKSINSKIFLSGQNAFFEKAGPYTGEISPLMLKNLGVQYSILGHWERRFIFNEDNKSISKKVKNLLNNKMKVILCVGEEKRDSRGDFADFLEKQISESLSTVEKFEAKNIIIAYEPVWAIGGGKNSITSENLEQIIVLIKKILYKKFNQESKKIKILYGGSVGALNAKELISVLGLDGFLLGRASLKKELFSEIVKELNF